MNNREPLSKSKKLMDAMAKLEKTFGKGAVTTLGNTRTVLGNCISTGSMRLDKILGGGIALSRITEVYGPESSGKTTLCVCVAVQAQRQGLRVAYIDVENALDVEYAKQLGIDTNELIFAQPGCAEEAFEIVETLIRTGEIDLIIIDSVAMLIPKAELNADWDAATVAQRARMMSKAMGKLTALVHDSNCALVFINQLRQKIGMAGPAMGSNETTTGGMALKFAASLRLDVRKIGQVKEGDAVVGQKVKFKTAKNKICAPMQVCETILRYGQGFGGSDEVIELAKEYNLITGNGWYTLPDGKRVQGNANVISYYEENPEEFEKLKEMVRNKFTEVPAVQDFSEDGIDPNTGEVLE